MKKFFTISLDINFIIQLLILSGLTYIIRMGYNDHMELQRIKYDVEILKGYRLQIEKFSNDYDSLLLSFHIFKTRVSLSFDELNERITYILDNQKLLMDILNKNKVYGIKGKEKSLSSVEVLTAK